MRVFQRIGLVHRDASREEVIYCAREMNPAYPGIFDLSIWEIGRHWCRPQNPNCTACYLNQVCPKCL
jgi:endonuclease III